VNDAIREAFKGSGMGKREVARLLYGDPERWREFDRYLKTTAPRPSIAVALARIFGLPPTAFLVATPLEAVATELAEMNRRLQGLEEAIASLACACKRNRPRG
jgi:hypothetical protein